MKACPNLFFCHHCRALEKMIVKTQYAFQRGVFMTRRTDVSSGTTPVRLSYALPAHLVVKLIWLVGGALQ